MIASIILASMGSDKDGSPRVRQNISTKDQNTGIMITNVWVGLRALEGWWSWNHWSIILSLSNGQYACIQKNTDDTVACKIENSMEAACKQTWGKVGKKVRTSDYGSPCCPRSWDSYFKDLPGNDDYTFIVNDCQNFARQQVEDLTDKVVGVFPIEDGPTFTF
ncbi:hypothetical protein DFA_02831 [Cavenderia fasciculata]|uniref:Uncharacterized protein n=1 Tax=Cavenderia fasciculata TaxID=261658 RepID=F4PIK8_CACFS|nr:uncharacterized protein DFA_02831 [Cavenderia fasciculata]EGG24588.1 hypothetical protein DFA_02831 [Cavenderia fasciculata]|eukprot:XP_004362439.1 hypothetical protein DFA_02831 [Cavenderia fasciculata]